MAVKETVCALVPTYNRAHYIEETLLSVLNQSRQPDVIRIINDGSADETDVVVGRFIEEHGGKGVEISLISKENGGKSSALNLGMKDCDADYIWICDDDDLAVPDALEKMLEAMARGKDVNLVYGHYDVFTEQDGERVFTKPAYWRREEEPDEKINFLEGMFTNQFAMLVKRSLYEQVGPFDEEFIRSQDYEMTLRLARKAVIEYVPQVLFYYRQHDGVRGASKNKFSAAENKNKWLEYEQKILTRVDATYVIDEFCPSFARELSDGVRLRAAYIQKAFVMARHYMWHECFTALKEAALASDGAITDGEQHLLELMLDNLKLWNDLKSKGEMHHRLREIAHINDTGAKIVFHMFRPTVWLFKQQLKNKDAVGAFMLLGFSAKQTGVKLFAKRVFRTLFG